jgi:hypothetical protein
MKGPGKYDHLCTLVREQALAEAALILVLGGLHGDGFSVQANFNMSKALPKLLRSMADAIEKDVEAIQ